MRRFPISGWAWLWPPLWPFLLVFLILWLLTFWISWVLFHLALTIVMTTAEISVGAPIYYPVIVIGVFLAHLAFYIWAQIQFARGRAERARAASAQQAYLDPQWREYYRQLDMWNAVQLHRQRVERERNQVS